MPILNTSIMKMIIAGFVAFLIALSLFSFFQHLTISSLERQKEENLKSITVYESAILYQNEEVEEYRVNKEDALATLLEWKSLPAEVKYKTIYKTIYKDINITKEISCEDKSIIESNTYSLDWNNL